MDGMVVKKVFVHPEKSVTHKVRKDTNQQKMIHPWLFEKMINQQDTHQVVLFCLFFSRVNFIKRVLLEVLFWAKQTRITR